MVGSLGGFGALLAGTWLFRRPIVKNLFMTGDFDTSLLSEAPSSADQLCVLTSRQVEGPFYFPSPQRQDLREDRLGLKLELAFQVLHYPDCSPVEGAAVEIWHCDAEGSYSGYPEEISHDIWKSTVFLLGEGDQSGGEIHVDPVNEQRFLRGLQKK